MSKKIKELELNDLRKALKGVRDCVLLQPLKLDSAADYTLRKQLRDKKVRVKMVKNTLVKKVFAENGVAVDPGSGPTLLCWGADSPKALGTAVKDALKALRPDPKLPEKVKEKTGVADGTLVSLEQLSKIPTKQEAIGEVLAAILGPGSTLAAAIMGPANNLGGLLKAIEDKGGGAPPAG
jgi:large subunit ribosomal protein L10